MGNIDQLREGGVAHPKHDFTDEEIERLESLSEEEVQALISVKQKLGHDLVTKQHGADDETHPDTLLL